MDVHRCRRAPAPLDATVSIPGSKSLTNRALVTAALADGTSILRDILLAEDTWLMIEALRGLGIAISVDTESAVAEVTGCRGHIPAEAASIHCGNAGTVLRFLMAVVASGHGVYTFDGVPRMRERPIGGLVDALRALGTGVEYLARDGYPPIRVHAHGLRGGEVEIASPDSSQWVSAVLLAAPYAHRDAMISVTGRVISKPYLTMTTAVMADFGVAVVEQFDESGARFIVEATQQYQGTNWTCEPDASNASYFLAAPAIVGGRVTVSGLDAGSRQGDVRFVDVLGQMGCRIDRASDGLTVHGPTGVASDAGPQLRAIDVDLNAMPDVAPTLAVLALFADGPTTIRNVANLRIKETDRLAALARELTKLGATVEERPDGIRITPPSSPRGATIETYEDHRMAMAFALAGLRIPNVDIRNPRSCAKTFPDFFDRLDRMLSSA